MKRNDFQIFFLVILFFSAAALVPAVLAESYPMACRGGGAMHGYLNATGGRTILVIDFRKANNHQNLQPGECAWVDRPIRSDEPSTLTYSISSSSIKAIVSFGKVEFQIQANKDLQTLLDAIQNGKNFHVYCENVGDTFRIAKVGL